MQNSSRDKSKIDLYYKVYGAGNPVLFLHGFGSNMYSWRHLVPLLSKHHKLILLDLKGFGASPKPHDKNYSAIEQANIIYQFILHHDLKKLTIIGHSFGGGVALLTALKLKKENPVRLISIILIDSIAYPQPLPYFIKILRTPILGYLSVFFLSSKRQVSSILKLAYYDDSKISNESIEAYALPIDSPNGRYALIQTAKQIIPSNFEKIAFEYKMIQVPTLIIWGRQDAIVPLDIGERLQKTIPNSQLVIIEKTGHIPHEENPEKVINSISNFLLAHNKFQED